MMKKFKFTPLQIAAHIAALDTSGLAPLGLLAGKSGTRHYPGSNSADGKSRLDIAGGISGLHAN